MHEYIAVLDDVNVVERDEVLRFIKRLLKLVEILL